MLTSRFDFTIILPATLAPHDYHHDGKVTHEIVAEVEGIPMPTSLFSFRKNSRAGAPQRSPSPRGTVRSGLSRSPSPSSPPLAVTPPSTEATFRRRPSAHLTTQNMSMIRQDASLPLAPSYEQSQADTHGPNSSNNWVRGTIRTRRHVGLFHNPSRTNEPTQLDERSSGFVPGLGMYDFHVSSGVVSPWRALHMWIN